MCWCSPQRLWVHSVLVLFFPFGSKPVLPAKASPGLVGFWRSLSREQWEFRMHPGPTQNPLEAHPFASGNVGFCLKAPASRSAIRDPSEGIATGRLSWPAATETTSPGSARSAPARRLRPAGSLRFFLDSWVDIQRKAEGMPPLFGSYTNCKLDPKSPTGWLCEKRAPRLVWAGSFS